MHVRPLVEWCARSAAVVMVAAGCRSLVPPRCTVLPDTEEPAAGLHAAAWWSFEDADALRVRDVSGRRHEGRAFAVRRTRGVKGTAYVFGADRSRVVVPSAPDLQLGRAITLTAWVLPGPPTGESRVIVSKNDEYALRIDNPREGGRLSFFVHVGRPGVTWEPRVSTVLPVGDGRWHHVAAVWDGTELRLYVDGVQRSRRPRTGRSYPTPYPVVIGNWEYRSCHGGRFAGAIDEVGIFGRALSEAEIRRLAVK